MGLLTKGMRAPTMLTAEKILPTCLALTIWLMRERSVGNRHRYIRVNVCHARVKRILNWLV